MDIVFSLLFLTVIILITRNIYVGVTSAPYAATPKKVIKKALELTKLKPGEKFYDLGSGDGRAVILATQEFGAEATGFELSWQWYLISKLNILLSGAAGLPESLWLTWRAGTRVFLKDLYHKSIADADVVFSWLNPRAFKKLEEKLKRELKPGARVVTFPSPLGFSEPKEVITFGDTARLFLYVVHPQRQVDKQHRS